jgi:hypothetical protein
MCEDTVYLRQEVKRMIEKMMRKLIFTLHHRDKIKEADIGGTCSTSAGMRNACTNSVRKSGSKIPFEDLAENEMIK